MRLRAAGLAGEIVGVLLLCAVMFMGGAAKSATITHNGEPVFDILDSGYLPVSVDSAGSVSRIYRNMTSQVLERLRMVFVPALREAPDVRGANVLRADVNEVVYDGLNILPEQMFRLSLSRLEPDSRFALAGNNDDPLDYAEIDRVLRGLDGPPVAQLPPPPVPLPAPILMLGAALALLYGATRRAHRSRS